MSKSKKQEKSVLELVKERIRQNEEKPDQIVELDLSQIPIKTFTNAISREIEACSKTQVLLGGECQLTSLENLTTKLPLVAVDFSNNQLTDADLQHLVKFTNLRQLILRNNKITELESLRVLTALKELQEVDFIENPVSKKEGYSEFLFNLLPKLEVVDEKDKDGNQVLQQEEFDDESDEEDEDDDSEEEFGSDQDQFGEDQEEEESQKPPQPKKKQHK